MTNTTHTEQISLPVRVKELGEAKGMTDPAYVDAILDELANMPAYELTVFDNDVNNVGLWVGAVMETVNETYCCDISDFSTLTYGQFLYLVKMGFLCQTRQIKPGEVLIDKQALDLIWLMRCLQYGKKRTMQVKKLFDLNYGAFCTGAFERYVRTHASALSREQIQSLQRVLCKPCMDRFADVFCELDDKIKRQWYPQDPIGKFRNEIRQGYSQIDEQLFHVLYFGCAQKVALQIRD